MYTINFKFIQHSATCLWSVDRDTFAKHGIDVDINSVPISGDLRSLLQELINIHDEHYKESREAYVFKKGERQVFREKFDVALKQLRTELGGEYTIIDCCSGDI